MFTGLIREIGIVKKYQNNILSIKAKHKAKIGDSIAINGVCLTVIALNSDGFDLELSDETRAIIDKSKLRDRVHIEPALSFNDRFEGHIVQGHIDCIGEIKKIKKNKNSIDFIIEVDNRYIKYIVPKGSITIDGVSLTVNDVYSNSFRLTIIPHTLKETLIKNYIVGSKINIETDLFARYIEHILNNKTLNNNSITWNDIDAINMGY
jgi:riboflavin synthase